MELIPYIASGYQNLLETPASQGGDGKFYQSELLGGGLRFDAVGRPDLVVSASAEGFAVLGGPGRVPSQNFNGDLGASAEERVSLDADYRLNRTWHAFAGLGINHFEYSGSNVGNSGMSSLGTTLQIDSTFGVAYGF